jgi:hypothetical protein
MSQLREQDSKNPPSNYEVKYKKALKEISGIIKANRQLKEELTQLTISQNSQAAAFGLIKKE